MLEIYLPSDVTFIIDRMHSCGYSAHVVGGSVRDSLIGRELEDFDITTDALPEQTKAVFSDYRTVDTGIRHGTVTLVLNAKPYEITTYRVDGDYKDNRHPESVTFTASLEEDLARRDFTVNAMAYSPSVGLVDPFDGVHDLQRHIIRAVGDPYRRFNEDALRILRALRFSSTLGFDIDESTSRSARELSSNLESISKERVYTELKKLISGTNAHRVLLEYADIIAVAFGGLYVKELPNYERFLNADYFTRLAAIFDMNSEDPISVADNVLASLKTDKFTRTHTVSVLRAYKEADFTDERAALKTLARYGKEATDGALSLGILEKRFTNSDREVFMGALNSAKPYTVSGLALRGGDLSAIGIKGEAIGASLEKLLYAVIDGSVENERSALIGYLSRDAEV